MMRPDALAHDLTGSTNGRDDIEALIRRARQDPRTAGLSQAKLSRLVRSIVRGDKDAVPASLRHMLAWADPTGETVVREVCGHHRSSLGTFDDRLARAGGAR